MAVWLGVFPLRNVGEFGARPDGLACQGESVSLPGPSQFGEQVMPPICPMSESKTKENQTKHTKILPETALHTDQTKSYH